VGEFRQVCVFCGSSDSVPQVYRRTARELGVALAGRGLVLVYGGGNTGLMGEVADSALSSGGRVIGVIPSGFNTPQLAHNGLSEMRVVGTMHERKSLMSELADGFIALPGGFGTLEELFEILTWAQIGLHTKPVAILEHGEYYAPLMQMIERARSEGFIYDEHRSLLIYEREVHALLDRMAAYTPPAGLERWVNRTEEIKG
jgi:uncharacterized protein (TIGR00730 family)